MHPRIVGKILEALTLDLIVNFQQAQVLTVEWCWTITNIVHSILMYLLMHSVKGTPFHTTDQGSSRFLTGWEQMDGEEQVRQVV